MKFHGITMEGEYKAQSVVDVSALVWESDDERRIVYDETTNGLWLADSSDWKSIGGYGDIPQGTQMWFYANSQPDGWTINGAPSDVLLAVEGGAYVTGGTEDGDWTTPPHFHSMPHAHGASGTVSVQTANAGNGDSGDSTSWRLHQHGLSVSATGQSPSTNTSTDGAVAGYRPLSRVGIICSKD